VIVLFAVDRRGADRRIIPQAKAGVVERLGATAAR
jgi:hypothetical protein